MSAAVSSIEQLARGIDNPVSAVFYWSFLTFNSYWALRPGFTMPSTIIHETCHYLAEDTSHFGLKPIEYSERNEKDIST